MNDSLLAVSIIGGTAVLLSYAFLFYDPDADKAWGGIETGVYRSLWMASTGLTTACYLFLWTSFVFFIEEQSIILLYSWLVFLISASQWGYLTLIDIKEGKKSTTLLINLVLTASACVGIFVVSLNLKGHDELRPWLIAASVIMFLHHAIADAWLWYLLFPEESFVPV